VNRAWARWAAAAVSGLLLAAARPPWGHWWLAWLALAPLAAAVRRSPDARSAADLGGLAGFCYAAAGLPWLTKVFGVWTPALWCVFALGPALWAAVLHGAGKRLDADRGGFAWAASAGLLWAGVEVLRAHLPGLSCSWLALGYSQAEAVPLFQAASVVGAVGLSAACAASGAALALAAEGRRLPAELALAAVGLAWGLGERRLERPYEGKAARAAVVQDEGYDLDRLVKLSEAPAVRDADLVVWPEYQLAVNEGHEDSYRNLYARRLSALKGTKLLGAAVIPEDVKAPMQNFVWALGPRGELLGRVDKARPIPFIERRLRGHRDHRPIETPLGPVGVQVCYDFDFEDGARALAGRGARLLAVPVLDPAEWGPGQHAQHLQMARARAVETGLWVARATSSGQSQLIDPSGRVTASVPDGVSGAAVGEVRLAESRTPYAAWGWLLCPLTLLALAAAATDAVLASMRRRAFVVYPPAEAASA
jgi:apolipoprotein N-acyltransferase